MAVLPQLRRLTRPIWAVVVILALLTGPLAPALQAWTDSGKAMCSLHGRTCTCPEMCERDKHGGDDDNDSAPESATDGPSCHRVPSSNSAPSPPPKKSCEMKSCGVGGSFSAPLDVAFSLPALDPETGRIAPLIARSSVIAPQSRPSPVEHSPPAPPPRV